MKVFTAPENFPEGNLDPQMCGQCSGLCCQGHPGAWVDPDRFFSAFFPGKSLSFDLLERELPDPGLVLRDFSGVPAPAPIGTESGCFFLSPEGCRLSVEQRPCQCLALVPSLDTLIDGEIRCQLTPGFGFASVRANWEKFWKLAGR